MSAPSLHPWPAVSLPCRRPRASKEEFDGLVGEFMDAVKSWMGHVVVQFEDFGNTNAFR